MPTPSVTWSLRVATPELSDMLIITTDDARIVDEFLTPYARLEFDALAALVCAANGYGPCDCGDYTAEVVTGSTYAVLELRHRSWRADADALPNGLRRFGAQVFGLMKALGEVLGEELPGPRLACLDTLRAQLQLAELALGVREGT